MFKWNPFDIIGEAPASMRFFTFGSQKATSKPVQLPSWSGEQQQLFRTLTGKLQTGMEGGVPTYPGNMYVPELPEETAYLGKAGDWASQLASLRANIAQPAFAITPETTEQFYQGAIKAPMMQEFREITEPGIREAFSGPGYWGSARAGAQANAYEHLATTLGAARANLAYQDELARRGALETAAGREATYGPGTVAAEAGIMGTAGQYARMIDQEQVFGDLQRWLMGETVEGVTPEQYSPFMQLVYQALGLSPYTYGQETKQSGWNVGVSGGGLLGK